MSKTFEILTSQCRGCAPILRETYKIHSMSSNLKFAGTTETRPPRGWVGGSVKTTYKFIGKLTKKTYVELLVIPADHELRQKIAHYTINPKNMKLEATKTYYV